MHDQPFVEAVGQIGSTTLLHPYAGRKISRSGRERGGVIEREDSSEGDGGTVATMSVRVRGSIARGDDSEGF